MAGPAARPRPPPSEVASRGSIIHPVAHYRRSQLRPGTCPVANGKDWAWPGRPLCGRGQEPPLINGVWEGGQRKEGGGGSRDPGDLHPPALAWELPDSDLPPDPEARTLDLPLGKPHREGK